VAPGAATGAVANASESGPLAGHLGPAGAPVVISGTVVGSSAGRPVLECNGRYYLVVRGRPVDAPRKGDPMRLAGRVVGSSVDGLFYVEMRGP
jgi:hypothetical protein